MGVVDRARYFATLFIECIADAIRDGIDTHFAFARYGESLATSQPTELQVTTLRCAAGSTRSSAAISMQLPSL